MKTIFLEMIGYLTCLAFGNVHYDMNNMVQYNKTI